MRSNPFVVKREIPKLGGAPIILGSVFIGLVLASFTMLSPLAGIMALSSGIVITITMLLRRADYLIFAWFVLTTLLWFIMGRLLSPDYYPFMGRGIFWGLLLCTIAAWAIDNILKGRQFTPFENVPLKAAILIFLLWCTVTLLTSVDVLNSVKKLSHIVIAFVASYMFYDFFSRNEDHIRKTLKIVSLAVTFVSLIVAGVAVRSLINGLPIYKEIQLWFLNPNILGRFLMVCIPILITSGFVSRPIKRLKFLFVSLIFLALFFSFSRAAWLGSIVSALIYCGKEEQNYHWRVP